ncbi:hypothetical protein Syun_021112 [Stephania yunnanensis]|uniref:Uncharacterized protein n=1 Tax=Stephania yunnanensis TaxID=152371 RepID=A0AAP0IFS4_9MAGN
MDPRFVDGELAYYNLYYPMLGTFLVAMVRVVGAEDVKIVVYECGNAACSSPNPDLLTQLSSPSVRLSRTARPHAAHGHGPHAKAAQHRTPLALPHSRHYSPSPHSRTACSTRLLLSLTPSGALPSRPAALPSRPVLLCLSPRAALPHGHGLKELSKTDQGNFYPDMQPVYPFKGLNNVVNVIILTLRNHS